jgi:uncharacterized membrane protein YkoI
MQVRRPAAFAALSWLTVLSLGWSAAVAGGRHHAEDRQQGAERHGGISLDEAVRRAERQFHARVVKAETRIVDGRTMHILRLVSDDGRVFTVRVNADSGNME